MLRSLLVTTALALASAGKAEFSTSNLCSKASLENVKATWDKKLDIAGHTTKLSCSYDLKAKQNFFSTASLSGTFKPPFVSLGYDLSHSFKSGVQALKLSAAAKGAVVKAAVDAKGAKLTEVSSNVDVQKVSLRPSYKPPSEAVELSISAGSVGANVGYSLRAAEVEWSLEASHELQGGRELSAELDAGGVELTYTDEAFEEGATWSASLSAPFAARKLNDLAMVVKRSVTF